MHLRCPHCDTQLDFAAESSVATTTCPECGEEIENVVPSDTVNRTLNPNKSTALESTVLESPALATTFVPQRTSAETPLTDIIEFGDYEILHEIARGGMGVVYKARQKSLNRIVALKMILSGHLASKKDLKRFQSEAEAAAGLDHPNIVPVYEVGEVDDQHFFSMGYVEGESLARKLVDGPLPPREAAELTKTIAEAVEYSHRKGIVHRDLKPGNVLIDENGQPKVSDFGLAKQIESDSSMTATGQILGTPNYMSPEQAAGQIEKVGPLSDVYSLGAILYCTLTGRPPFQAASTLDTLKQVMEQEPVSPKVINPAVDKDLETICLKCLEKEPAKRYQTAQELAEELNLFLQGIPILARPVGRIERGRRWCKRNKLGATVISLLLLLALGGPVVAFNQTRLSTKALREKNRADDKVVELAQTNKELIASNYSERQAKEDAKDVLNYVQDKVFAAARPEGQEGGLGVKTTIREAIDAAEPDIAESFKDRPIVEAAIRNSLGNTYLYLEEAKLAIIQHKRARELRESNLGLEHPDTLQSMNNLAAAYRSVGKLLQSFTLYEETLKLKNTMFGSEHPETLGSMSSLAGAYGSIGKFKEAISLYEETLNLQKTKLGPQHAATLRSMNGLAGAYHSAGKLDLAFALHEKTLNLKKAIFGSEHPATLGSMHNLAGAYESKGNFKEAISLYEETLKLRKTRLGREHAATLRSMNGLASAYHSAGNLDLAMSLLEETLKLSSAKYGSEHPVTLLSMNNLAQMYRNTGNLKEALPLYEKTLKLLREKNGPDHPYTLTLKNNLAQIYQSAGRLDEALPLYEETLKLRKLNLGREHPDTLTSMNNLGSAYKSAGRLSEALLLFDEALKLRKKKLGLQHPQTLDSIGYLAITYLMAKQPKKAMPLFEQFIAGERLRAQPDDPRFAALIMNLSADLLKHAQYSAAERYLRECLAIMKKKLPNHAFRFVAQCMLGGALVRQKKFVEAEQFLLEGYEGMKQRESDIPAASRFLLITALQRLVDLYTAWNKPEKAAEWQKILDAEKAKLQKQKKKSKPKKQTDIKTKKLGNPVDKKKTGLPLIAPRPATRHAN